MERIKPNKIHFQNFKGDLFGGLTAAVVALPLALAFGVASGAGPVAGLYGAICVGFFASLFGGTATQISGPTGPMTIISASVFTQFGDRPAMAFTVVMMAGGLQLLFGYFKLGRYINLMPYPVISGFMTGIGCILIIMQLDPLLGFSSPPNVVNALTVLPEYLNNPNIHSVVLGVIAFLIAMFSPRRLKRIVPSPLIALITCTILALIFSGAPLLGHIPSSLPALHLPQISFGDLNEMLILAAVLAALGSIDSLLTSLVADNVTRTFHDSDKELVGQGLGNIAAGLLGAIPGAGASIRTLANVHAGGQTALSGIIHALILLMVVLGLGPLVSLIPHAALAGILLKVGIDVIDWRYIRRMHRAPRSDFVLMLVVLLLTVIVNVITAVAVGVVLASVIFVKQMADLQSESIRAITDPDHVQLLNTEETRLFRDIQGRTLLLHLSGLMSFGAANEMTRRFAAVGSYDVLIIDLIDVPRIDGSAALALETIIQRAHESHQKVLIVGLTYSVARLLIEIGALAEVRDTDRFETRSEAIRSAAAWLAQQAED